MLQYQSLKNAQIARAKRHSMPKFWQMVRSPRLAFLLLVTLSLTLIMTCDMSGSPLQTHRRRLSLKSQIDGKDFIDTHSFKYAIPRSFWCKTQKSKAKNDWRMQHIHYVPGEGIRYQTAGKVSNKAVTKSYYKKRLKSVFTRFSKVTKVEFSVVPVDGKKYNNFPGTNTSMIVMKLENRCVGKGDRSIDVGMLVHVVNGEKKYWQLHLNNFDDTEVDHEEGTIIGNSFHLLKMCLDKNVISKDKIQGKNGTLTRTVYKALKKIMAKPELWTKKRVYRMRMDFHDKQENKGKTISEIGVDYIYHADEYNGQCKDPMWVEDVKKNEEKKGETGEQMDSADNNQSMAKNEHNGDEEHLRNEEDPMDVDEQESESPGGGDNGDQSDGAAAPK